MRGSVRRAAFEPDALADPAIRALAAKVVHTVDPGCEAAFPGARSARVAIVTTDGRRFEHFAPTRKGDPDSPLTDAELDAKFHELTDEVLGAEAAGELLSRLRAPACRRPDRRPAPRHRLGPRRGVARPHPPVFPALRRDPGSGCPERMV